MFNSNYKICQRHKINVKIIIIIPQKNGIKGIFSMHIYVIDIKSYHKQLTIDCFCQKGSYKIVVFKVIVENVVNIN